MQALYRKYRSKSLAEVVGQEHITQTLGSAIKNGRISHAYLFTGPRGVGKTSVARIVAHEINGLPYGDVQHLDIIEIDAASNRRIDDIRDLRDKVHIAPVSAKYKVYIIDEVHMLTGESFNALLKTLEEPPAHVVFILATTEVHKLPATIISRTQRYSFRLVPSEKVVEHLASIAQQENIAIDTEALELIAEHGEGSFRDSISLLDQLANVSHDVITAQTVEMTLGLAPRSSITLLLEALSAKDRTSLIIQLEALSRQGVTSSSLLPQLIKGLQHAAPSNPTFYELIDKLLDVPRAYNPDMKLLTVLVGYTIEPGSISHESKPPSQSTAITQPQHQDQATTTPPPVAEPEDTPDEDETDNNLGIEPEVNVPEPPHTSQATLSPEAWDRALIAIKKTSPPLHGILVGAQLNFDPDTRQLTLTLRTAFHRKRAEDAKQSIAKVLEPILGYAPTIIAALDGTAAPAPPRPSSSLTLDPAAQSVADIMGGGEIVEAHFA